MYFTVPVCFNHTLENVQENVVLHHYFIFMLPGHIKTAQINSKFQMLQLKKKKMQGEQVKAVKACAR